MYIRLTIPKKEALYFMLIAYALTANAQVFIEGNLSVSYSNDESSDIASTYSNSSTGINISPKVWYWLNDKFAIGASMSIINSSDISDSTKSYPDYYMKHEIKIRNMGLGFSVFSRYKILGTEKLSLLLESSIGVQRITTKINEYAKNQNSNWSGFNKYDMFSFSISIAPVVSYDLTKNISIITTSDFLSLNFLHSIKKDEYSGRNTSNNLGFGAQSTIFSSLGGIRMGFTYKFNNFQ